MSSNEDTRMQLPSREKLTLVTGTGMKIWECRFLVIGTELKNGTCKINYLQGSQVKKIFLVDNKN